MKVIAKWEGTYLWDGQENKRGLAVEEDLKTFKSMDVFLGMTGSGTYEDYLQRDLDWKKAFDKIFDGLPPSWRECSCGAKTVMGLGWNNHTPLCESIILSSPFTPKNNDGLEFCFKCGEPNKAAGGGAYLICNNKDCDWYER